MVCAHVPHVPSCPGVPAVGVKVDTCGKTVAADSVMCLFPLCARFTEGN